MIEAFRPAYETQIDLIKLILLSAILSVNVSNVSLYEAKFYPFWNVSEYWCD